MPRTALLASSLCLGWSAPVLAAPVWIGDFETGDLSQYEGTLNQTINGVDYITVVQDVVAQGQYAARIELHDDAEWGNGLRRVELHHSPADGRTAEGAHTWFAWSLYLPQTLPVDPAQGIGYWESDQSYQSLMVWDLAGETITFSTRHPEYVQQWQADVATARQWHRIAVHVLWSTDPALGRVDVWWDGEQVVTDAAAATLVDGNPAFTQFGLIRGDMDFADVPVIYIDDAVEGDSLDDVHPSLEPGGGDTSTGGSSDGGSATTGDGSSSGGGASGADTTAAGGSSDGGVDDTATAGTGAGSSGGESTGAADDDASGGCGCVTARDRGGWALLVLVTLSSVRRRRAA
ncbi:MAG: polysaccharide lyase [Nannocystaceae bacterium]